MKHPSFKKLQDYFEAEGDDESITPHVEVCDRCSGILAEMAKVDVFFSNVKDIKVSEKTKSEVFFKASNLLEQKRELRDSKRDQKNLLLERKKKIIETVSEMRESALSELKLPVLQSAMLTILIVVFTKISTTEIEIETYKIIDSETSVFYSEDLGDENENS